MKGEVKDIEGGNLFQAHHERAGFFGKDNNARKAEGSWKRGRTNRDRLIP